MALTWHIVIIRNRGGGYSYAPESLEGVEVGDEVFFANNDTEPHWPGLVGDPAVSPANSTTFFMPNQIAPNSTSSPCIPSAGGTVTYADSLDTSASPPQGTIVVTDPAAPSATTLAAGATS